MTKQEKINYQKHQKIKDKYNSKEIVKIMNKCCEKFMDSGFRDIKAKDTFIINHDSIDDIESKVKVELGDSKTLFLIKYLTINKIKLNDFVIKMVLPMGAGAFYYNVSYNEEHDFIMIGVFRYDPSNTIKKFYFAFSLIIPMELNNYIDYQLFPSSVGVDYILCDSALKDAIEKKDDIEKLFKKAITDSHPKVPRVFAPGIIPRVSDAIDNIALITSINKNKDLRTFFNNHCIMLSSPVLFDLVYIDLCIQKKQEVSRLRREQKERQGFSVVDKNEDQELIQSTQNKTITYTWNLDNFTFTTTSKKRINSIRRTGITRKAISWDVCGHDRHYKNGKVAHVKPYTKGQGERQKKNIILE